MNPTNTILAFDLHSVVFTPDWKKVIHILLRWPHKMQLVVCAFNIRLIRQCFTLLFHEPTDEEFFALFHERCPKLLPLSLELFNSFKPMDGTVELLKELSTKGYVLHIASNVGPRRFKTLQSHFPLIMNLFDKAMINNGDVKNLIKKPNPEFFRLYLRDYNPDGKQIVFIDNNKHNIKAAEPFGITCIHFKSPNQLRDALTQLNIL